MKWHVHVMKPAQCKSDSTYATIVYMEKVPSHTLASFDRYDDAKEFLGSVIKNYIPDDWSLHRKSEDDVLAWFHYVSPSYEP